MARCLDAGLDAALRGGQATDVAAAVRGGACAGCEALPTCHGARGLREAAAAGKADIVAVLVAHGASVDARDTVQPRIKHTDK